MAAALAAGLALGACGPVPQPFSHEGPVTNPMAKPGVRAGISVLPVSGTPHGSSLAEGVAEALRSRNLAAYSATGANGFAIRGAVRRAPPADAARGAVGIVWSLRDSEGRTAGSHLQEIEVSGPAWRRGDPVLLARLADEAVAGLAPLVADTAAEAQVRRPPVAVADVDAAPGDGRISLRRAIAFELERAGLSVAEAETGRDGALVLAGAVKTRPAGPEQELVEITWTLLAPNGRVIGTLTQSNRVTRGSLSPNWGVTAALAARAAAPGVVRLIDRAAGRPMKGG